MASFLAAASRGPQRRRSTPPRIDTQCFTWAQAHPGLASPGEPSALRRRASLGSAGFHPAGHRCSEGGSSTALRARLDSSRARPSARARSRAAWTMAPARSTSGRARVWGSRLSSPTRRPSPSFSASCRRTTASRGLPSSRKTAGWVARSPASVRGRLEFHPRLIASGLSGLRRPRLEPGCRFRPLGDRRTRLDRVTLRSVR